MDVSGVSEPESGTLTKDASGGHPMLWQLGLADARRELLQFVAHYSFNEPRLFYQPPAQQMKFGYGN